MQVLCEYDGAFLVNNGELMTKLLSAFGVMLVICATGCSLQLVDLESGSITPISPDNAPLTISPDGHRSIEFTMRMTGSTQTLPYDRLIWLMTRMPCVRTDQGLADPARVDLDIVQADGYPAYLGEPVNLAYIHSLGIGSVTIVDFPAVIMTKQWQVRTLGIPIYRDRAWTLGMPILKQMKFLALNNPQKQVTFGYESFTQWPTLNWHRYEMTFAEDTRPYVSLPVAGVELRLLADTGGGPSLILNQQQWDKIKHDLQILHHAVKDYPTWGKYRRADTYRVTKLKLGPVILNKPVIWVRHSDESKQTDEVGGLIGLGPLAHQVLVWDFEHGCLWIGTTQTHIDQ
jgi:hypothetical protein